MVAQKKKRSTSRANNESKAVTAAFDAHEENRRKYAQKLKCPPGTSPKVRKQFNYLVLNSDVDDFTKADIPALVQLSRVEVELADLMVEFENDPGLRYTYSGQGQKVLSAEAKRQQQLTTEASRLRVGLRIGPKHRIDRRQRDQIEDAHRRQGGNAGAPLIGVDDNVVSLGMR